MELNFDKEMDALLRQAARRQEIPAPLANAATAGEAHLDADELSAFSANALPVKARARAMEHLVDCGNCRTILSNLVFFENREEEEPAAAFAVAAPVTAVKEASLIERILGVFKFPTLAYGMAALVLLFTGAIGFMILRSNYSGAEMAQVSNKELSPATKAVSEQLQNAPNNTVAVVNTDTAANTSPMAAAANNAMGGAFSGPPQGIPVGGTFAANTSSNAASTLRKDVAGPGDEEQFKIRSAPIDRISNDAAPPPPAPATGVRQEQDLPALAKPQQAPLTDQVTTRSQDNFRNNNVQNTTILTPDGSDKDRSRRAVSGEAGANVPREAARDEKEKLDENKSVAPAKTEVKKAAAKKAKKNAAAAAEASATPAPTPAKTPEPKKKPDDEERPPCK